MASPTGTSARNLHHDHDPGHDHDPDLSASPPEHKRVGGAAATATTPAKRNSSHAQPDHAPRHFSLSAVAASAAAAVLSGHEMGGGNRSPSSTK